MRSLCEDLLPSIDAIAEYVYGEANNKTVRRLRHLIEHHGFPVKRVGARSRAGRAGAITGIASPTRLALPEEGSAMRPPDDEKKARHETGHASKGDRDDVPKAISSVPPAGCQQNVWPWPGRLPVREHLRPKPRYTKGDVEVCVELAAEYGACPHVVWDQLHGVPYFQRIDGLMYEGRYGINEALDYIWQGEA